MNIRVSDVTWYSRILTIVFIFGIFPIIVFMIGKKYQDTVSAISHAQIAVYESYGSEEYQRNTIMMYHSKFMQSIQGNWKNSKDKSYTLKVKDNNLFYDVKKGRVISSGSWMIRNSLDNTPYSNMENGVYLERNTLNNEGVQSMQYDKVISIDDKKMELFDLKRNGVVTYIREIFDTKTSTSTATSTHTATGTDSN
jgi:hypothetical protein